MIYELQKRSISFPAMGDGQQKKRMENGFKGRKINLASKRKTQGKNEKRQRNERESF